MAVPSNPDRYASGGHLLVLGTEKPTQAQTVGIKAIRKNLIEERQPDRLIWERRLPNGVLSFWDIGIPDSLHSTSGAFVSRFSPTANNSNLTVPLMLAF
ncbi:hypothetical protein JR316_0006597 [Psilocybe cubensis]|uniref:Uncharacterized protein n=2 Tax=Psilocybe cubensis TaxID=181762 RepID=A0A8H7XJM7_PSICU|nr:hypothetical protein JR316_0006597 [Psilocybe cubensis]KAH9480000.1 hypothetical protein JR316_0006597 [Psilocybe cubensis]